MDVNKKMRKSKTIFLSETTECSQPKGVGPRMTARKLRSGVNWQGILKQKALKQGPGLYCPHPAT
jgi:hypothetical protein